MSTPSARSSVRRTAGATVLTLVVGGAVLAAAPATAVSATLSYDCTSPLGPQVFTAVVDTNAPATLPSGQSVAIATTSVVTVPAAVADGLRSLGATSVDGTSTATGTVDGVARQSALAIPKTAVPPTTGTTMLVTGTGPSGSIAAGAAGSTINLGAGGFTASVTGYDGAGTSVGSYAFTCILPGGQNLAVDAVGVVAAPTTVALAVVSPVAYGDTPAVSADVAAIGSNAKPAGTVTFAFVGKTVTVDVKGGKAKAALPAALTLGVQPVTATFTPIDKNLAASSATKSLTVVRDSTSTVATSVYRAARDRMVGKAKVVADHGTGVAGQVRIVLKRDGTKIRTALVSINKYGGAKKVFKRIAKPGVYTVVARYLGSPTLRRSVDRVKTTI